MSLIFVYGMFTPFSSLGFLQFVPQNTQFISSVVPKWLQSLYPTYFSGTSYTLSRVTALLHLIMLPGYFIFGFYYQILKWVKNGISNLELILIYCALCGLIIWNFTEAEGASHYPFLHYAILTFGIFGANGTYLIFTDFYKKRTSFLCILSMLSLSMLCIRIAPLYYTPENWMKEAVDRFVNYKPFTGTYSSWSNEFLEKMSSLSQNKENLIFVSLLDKNQRAIEERLQDLNVLQIKLKGASLYSVDGLSYIHIPNILSNFEKRLSELKSNINSPNNIVLDDSFVKRFHNLFPGKDIIFLVEETKKVVSSQFKLLDNISGIQILKLVSQTSLDSVH